MPNVLDSKARIFVGFCIATLWMNSAFAQAIEAREQLIQRSLHQLHLEQFDSALVACAKMRQLWPEHPAGYLNAANVYQTMMRDYRVRIFEAQFTAVQLKLKE